MANVIFIKIRNDLGEIYPSYIDYWRLVELSGFNTCELDEVDPDSDNIYIASPNNGNLQACFNRPHKARFIIWQLERSLEKTDYGDEVWVSDRWLAKKTSAKYVPMGGHPQLGREQFEWPEQTKYDYAHISYLYGRREEMVSKISKEGARIAPMAFKKDDKDKILKESRALLCLHQDDLKIIEPLRYTVGACYGLPLIAEKSHDFHPYEVIKYPQLHSGRMKEMAENNYNRMTKEITFKKAIKEAL